MDESQSNGGCWLVYYSDWSGLAVFASELEALRFAVDKNMSCKFFPWGEVR